MKGSEPWLRSSACWRSNRYSVVNTLLLHEYSILMGWTTHILELWLDFGFSYTPVKFCDCVVHCFNVYDRQTPGNIPCVSSCYQRCRPGTHFAMITHIHTHRLTSLNITSWRCRKRLKTINEYNLVRRKCVLKFAFGSKRLHKPQLCHYRAQQTAVKQVAGQFKLTSCQRTQKAQKFISASSVSRNPQGRCGRSPREGWAAHWIKQKQGMAVKPVLRV